jgi:hypothetical protein
MSVSRFGPNVTVDGSSLGRRAAAYQAEVMDQLRQLLMFETGRILVNEIWRQSHRVRIEPQPAGRTAADTRPVSWADAEPRGVQVLDGNGLPIPRMRGTGRGSDVVIRYTPGSWGMDPGRWVAQSGDSIGLAGSTAPAGDERGEALVHELVHAYRDMLGLTHPRPMGRGFDTRGELIALVVQNLYAQERLRPLRAGHRGGTRTNYNEDMARPEFRHTLVGMMLEMPSLTNALARVPVPAGVPNLFARYGTPSLWDSIYMD